MRREPVVPERGSFGEALRAARTSLHLDQERFAQRIGASCRSVGRWEANRGDPPLAMMRQVFLSLQDVAPSVLAPLADFAEMALPTRPPAIQEPAAQLPAALEPAASHASAKPMVDAAVRAAAESLDVTAGSLRAALAELLGEVAASGLSVAALRTLVVEGAGSSARAPRGVKP